MDPIILTVVAVAGLLLGAVNSIAGGGSLLFFPTLLSIGIPPLPANVTNSVVVLPGFAGAVYGFRADLEQEPRGRLVLLSVVTAIGSAIGSMLLLVTPSSAFDMVVPALVLFASLLLAGQQQVRKLAGTSGPANADRSGRRRAAMMVIMMFAAAVYGGYFGGALGVIMLVVLELTTLDGLRSLNALKSALSLVVSTTSLPIFTVFGPVHWWAVAVAAPAALSGGYLGAKIARRMDEQVLRWCVVSIGVAVAVYLFLR